MPHANRYFLAGDVWRITHRREFLSQFARTRRRAPIGTGLRGEFQCRKDAYKQ